MTTLQRCLDLLEANHVPYLHTRHSNAYTACEVANAEHMPAQMYAKTVLLGIGAGYALAVLPADCRVDLDELEQRLTLSGIRLATEQEVRTQFPASEIGAMPPFGNQLMPVYMDVRLAEEPYIFFNAGTHRDAIHMSVADYLRLAEPVILRFAHPRAALESAAGGWN